MKLMRVIVTDGEVETLVAERVWQEFKRSLVMPAPWRFFEVLKQCGALRILFPEISRSFTKVITNLGRRKSAKARYAVLTADELIQFAVIVSPLTVSAIKSLCKRVKIPNVYRDLAVAVVKHKRQFQQALQLSSSKILKLFMELDAFRQSQKLDNFLKACAFLNNQTPSLQADFLRAAYKTLTKISAKPLVAKGLKGESVRRELDKMRIKKLQNFNVIFKSRTLPKKIAKSKHMGAIACRAHT